MNQYLSLAQSYSESLPLIQIGGAGLGQGRFRGLSQTEFLTRQDNRMPTNKKVAKKVTFTSDYYTTCWDTKTLFVSPRQKREKHDKLDIKSPCKIL